MEIIEKLILWILLSNLNGFVWCGSVTLNGPQLQASDLRAIDGYVSSGLPLFASSKGFVLHSGGGRPVIVKVKDPNKEIRDGIEQPNPSYYRNLPSVIPEGYEGIASTSFLLGHPIGPHNSSPFIGNTIAIQQTPTTYQQQQYTQTQLAEPSIRIENKIQPQNYNNQIFGGNNDAGKLVTNPVVVQTSVFESNLPTNLQNPFYSNQMVANSLARESLPLPGEEVVAKWDTNKIRTGKVRDLLVGAGFIS